MTATNLGRHLGNGLYKFAFPIYRPLYRTFKIWADRSERKLLRRHLPRGAFAVDAGANIGIYSEFLSDCVGPTGKIHSFEPDPHNFTRLQDALCQRSNLRLNQLAVSDHTGESALYVSENLNVDHRAYPPKGKSVAIRSVRLDDYFPPGERVDFIKVDIQGFELHALRGAERVLSDNPGAKLLLEFWPYGLRLAGDSAAGLLAFLRERALDTYRMEGSDLVSYEDSVWDENDPDTYLNLFVMPKGSLDREHDLP